MYELDIKCTVTIEYIICFILFIFIHIKIHKKYSSYLIFLLFKQFFMKNKIKQYKPI